MHLMLVYEHYENYGTSEMLMLWGSRECLSESAQHCPNRCCADPVVGRRNDDCPFVVMVVRGVRGVRGMSDTVSYHCPRIKSKSKSKSESESESGFPRSGDRGTRMHMIVLVESSRCRRYTSLSVLSMFSLSHPALAWRFALGNKP